MFPNTHIYIADMVIDQIKGDNINLNKTAFRTGSILPDFSPYHKHIKHYRDKSFTFVEKSIDNLGESKNIDDLSLRLGIISHYLADYFCYPHFNNMTFTSKDILGHIKYEKELNTYIRTFSNKFTEEYKFKSFIQLIESSTGEYKNSRVFDEDLESSLMIIINLITNVKGWNIELNYI